MFFLVSFLKVFLIGGLIFAVWNLVFTRLLMPKIFWLILLFVELSFLLLLHGVEFISFVLLLLYVGAVSVLFLFVVMILNPDSKQNLEKLALGAAKNTSELTSTNYFCSTTVLVFMLSLLCAETYALEFYNYLQGMWVQAWPFLLENNALHTSEFLPSSLVFSAYEPIFLCLDNIVEYLDYLYFGTPLNCPNGGCGVATSAPTVCDASYDFELEELKEALFAIDLKPVSPALPERTLNFYTSSDFVYDWDVAEFREAWYNTVDLYAAGSMDAVDYTKTYFSFITSLKVFLSFSEVPLYFTALSPRFSLVEAHTLISSNGFGVVPFAGVSANSDLWAIAESLYTQEFISFWVVSLILLISMIGTILLTLQKSRGIKHQKITNQSKRYHDFKH
jgi:NADH:ubiquinone oxidoreductase subunit 6 (subunit J)